MSDQKTFSISCTKAQAEHWTKTVGDGNRSAWICYVLDRAAMSPQMLVRCAWCKNDIRWIPCDAKMVGKISDGICPSCAEKMNKQLAEMATTGKAAE
jgi:hypothetical protein